MSALDANRSRDADSDVPGAPAPTQQPARHGWGSGGGPVCDGGTLAAQPQGWATSQLVSAAQLVLLSQLLVPPLPAM
ncbi:hypothetical protein KCMC57_up56820 [Kitasatospora sp. CMC57]|uniref:Uncharacterized protein n=1 Tax=Kitasatospora sp. CMC57 TaxID=3231513 RepID=A0AB33K629_9ACTN